MDPNSINEFMDYIIALKQTHAQQIQVLQQKLKNLEDELRKCKSEEKPVKSITTTTKK